MLQKSHWIRLSIILLVALCTKLALAESSHSKKNSGLTSSSSLNRQTVVTSTGSSRGKTYLGAGLGLATLNSSIGIAIDGQAMFRVNQQLPLYIGGTTGMIIYSGDYGLGYYSYSSRYTSYGSSTAVVIPILASATWVINEHKKIQPVVGAAMGILIGASGWNGTVGFMGYGRGGVGFKLSESITLDAEGKVGIIAASYGLGSLFFQPGATFNFKL